MVKKGLGLRGKGLLKQSTLNECLNKWLDNKTLKQTLKERLWLEEKGGIMIKENGSWLRGGWLWLREEILKQMFKQKVRPKTWLNKYLKN